MSKQDLRFVSTWVPAHVGAEFEALARENERSVSAELRLAIRDRIIGERGERALAAATNSSRRTTA